MLNLITHFLKTSSWNRRIYTIVICLDLLRPNGWRLEQTEHRLLLQWKDRPKSAWNASRDPAGWTLLAEEWIHVNSLILEIELTFSIRNILVRPRATRVPGTRYQSQRKTNWVTIARGAGNGVDSSKIKALPHWKKVFVRWSVNTILTESKCQTFQDTSRTWNRMRARGWKWKC